MYGVTQRPSKQQSLKVDLFRLNGFESYNNINLCGKKMIDICCVRSSVKYHTMSYWSIVMKSAVEFLTGEFREFSYEKSFKMDNQPEKK